MQCSVSKVQIEYKMGEGTINLLSCSQSTDKIHLFHLDFFAFRILLKLVLERCESTFFP